MATATRTKTVSFSARLRKIGACGVAVAWVGKRSAQTAWDEIGRAHV